MAKHKIIIISFICFSVAVLAGQRPSYMPPKLPPRKPGMTSDEYNKEIKKALDQQKRQERERDKEYINLMATEAWKHLLRVTEAQWKLIEPKHRKENDLEREMWIGAAGSSRDMESFHWNRPSDSPQHPMEGKTRDQMTEGYRIIEELIDLLEDEKSTDEQIRKKIDALQQARQKAREALPQAKKELAEVLTNTRQEAIFLIMGYID